MAKATMQITIQFREGADVQDEAYRFRQVFINHNIEVQDETYTKESVTYTIDCDVPSIGSLASILENKRLDVDEAVVDISFSQKHYQIPVLGTVKA